MIKLFNEDCLKAMKEMEDGQFDLAICDPPYGLKRDGHKADKEYGWKQHQFKGWDKSRPSKEYFDELRRVSKNQIIWGANYFAEYLPPSKGWIVWDKGQYGLSMSDCELAFSSFQRATRIYKCNRVQIMLDGSIHPTQKPVALYMWLLSNYTKKGWKILDTHLGSGSIAIACHDMNFDLTAFEIDTGYYEAALKRLQKHQKQLKLF